MYPWDCPGKNTETSCQQLNISNLAPVVIFFFPPLVGLLVWQVKFSLLIFFFFFFNRGFLKITGSCCFQRSGYNKEPYLDLIKEDYLSHRISEIELNEVTGWDVRVFPP